MSRVAQLDSEILDTELHNLFWNDVKQHFSNTDNIEEWKLLCDSIIFCFATKTLLNNNGLSLSTVTYGTRLNGLIYTNKRYLLYISTILLKYTIEKLEQKYFSINNSDINSFFRNFIKFWKILFNISDLSNFCRFISSNNNKAYLSVFNRLLKVSCNPVNQPTFMQNSRLSIIEFQNRQLLWNSILELLNIIILPNSQLLFRSIRTNNIANTTSKNQNNCPLCQELPCNPYELSCCHKIYCYICAVKTLEWKFCKACGKKKNLTAHALYN